MTRKAIIKRNEVEVLDFIMNTITAYENCDTWGSCDIFEKQKMCDKAKDFLNYYISIEK